MKEDRYKDSPMQQVISFDKLLEHYDIMAESEDKNLAAKAKTILKAQAPYPILREGFKDISLLKKYDDTIKIIFQDAFPEILTHNEIKVVSLPFSNLYYNPSERLKKILENAGEGFELKIRDLEDKLNYVAACVVVLKFHYDFNLDFTRPFYYDIPDANGVMRHYRILYNADYLEVLPTEEAKNLSQEDVDELLANFENIKLWKEKIPPQSFIAKGFIISNIFDVTAEHSISEIKSNLIGSDKRASTGFIGNLNEIFKSLFKLPEIRVGFITYKSKEDQFEKVYGEGIKSFILKDMDTRKCSDALCERSYRKLINENGYYAISDVPKYHKMYPENPLYRVLHDQKVKSAIMAPIADKGELLGVLELVSTRVNELNSVNAVKLEDVMPYIVAAVQRSKIEEENRIDAIIQNECTSIHSSVLWKFREEARRFIIDDLENRSPSFKEIVIEDVHPLYGQIDIKDSSRARNMAIQRDLLIQLSEINNVLNETWQLQKLPVYEELIFRVNDHIDEVKERLDTNSEQDILSFIKEEIAPIFSHIKDRNEGLQGIIKAYEAKIDMGTESFYDHRKNYDESVMRSNRELASVIDVKQVEAQSMFPHYFERYKTDGVEHNIYIGGSIAENEKFNALYFKNLRLWQLQVMCDMENAYYQLKPKLPLQLDVASLILVYNTTLSIRFRMDEKHFDVDGTYNARYEIIKKRIDKSYIKGTKERLTKAGILTIVYSQKSDELEYLRYLKFLKSKSYFTNTISIIELEGMSGVSGLKAIQVEILYDKDKKDKKTYTYQDLIEELKT